MPKLKTNKAARKRYKITKTGKVLRLKTKRRHLLSDKTSVQKRRRQGWAEIDVTDKKRIRPLLPYS